MRNNIVCIPEVLYDCNNIYLFTHRTILQNEIEKQSVRVILIGSPLPITKRNP